MAWRDARQSTLPQKSNQLSATNSRDPSRRIPDACDDDRWDCAETSEGPTRRRSANRACQLASSWSRSDHEDGGPTIQLPAAEARCTLRSLSCVQYTRLGPFARTVAVQRGSPDLSVVGPGISQRAKAATVHLTWPLSTQPLFEAQCVGEPFLFARAPWRPDGAAGDSATSSGTAGGWRRTRR